MCSRDELAVFARKFFGACQSRPSDAFADCKVASVIPDRARLRASAYWRPRIVRASVSCLRATRCF
jgi:hypothetical protein